ncbi:hypothetical protein C492_11275 [Natronococcus jeotgali DSM 18795]|uniref:Uncharacterized protein n=1 Tax=Natronococcus jeotgali DSM 18795 TaxID=1227498 RepID=L9XCY5_9EURY|nr:hypothetical protein C492_11275 [Natronococcus jeotgali DSM 18795]
MHSESLLAVAVGLPLHFGASLTENVLIVMLGVGAVFSILIALLSFAAFVKRRTVSYLLIAVAFSTFLGKTSLGPAYLLGSTNTEMHHLLEHTLDVVMMALVLAAVYYAYSSENQDLGSSYRR